MREPTGGIEEKEKGDDDGYRFPLWWFAVLASINIPNQLFATALWSIVWPKAIATMFGYENKATALSMVDTVNVFIGFANPFIGSLSDRLPDRYAKYCGRRRPFVLAGAGMMATGVWMIYFSIYIMSHGHDADLILLGGLFMGNIGSCLSLVPFGAIAIETIHPDQRGISLAIGTWVGGVCTLGGWGIGYLVGEGIVFTTPVIWWINILKFFVQLPLLWICCGGTAGWCTPERRRTVPQEEKKAAAALARTVGEGEDAGVTVDADVYWNRGRTLKWDPKEGKWEVCASPNCAERAADTMRDFSSAFYTPAFRWLWIQNFIASIGGTFSGYFFFYWMQDCFTEGFWLFNRWEVASNVQSAVAINGSVSSIIAVATSWSGSWWRDKFGGRQMCIYTGIVGIFTPFSYAFAPQLFGPKALYTVVFFWNVLAATLGGISSASAGALGMDCLPAGRDGRPLMPARDFGLMGWAGRISMLFLPIAIGLIIPLFPSHQMAYKYMYLTGGTISFIAFLVFAFMVHPLDEPRGLRMQCTRKWFHWKYDSERHALGDQLAREKYCNERDVALAARKNSTKGSEAPRGARLCDALLFEKPRMRSVHVGSLTLQ
jgi:Na+/melibiose symporter-like transporter